MSVYVIGYDLNRPHQDYPGLITAIKAYGTWWHNLDSTWIVVTDETAVQVANNLRRHIDGNDKLLVIEHRGAAAWVGFHEQGSNWLKQHV